MRSTPFMLTSALIMASPVAQAGDEPMLIVVTAEPSTRPLIVVSDPQVPRQPLPAQDGADYLKTVPGFSVIRKGGTDGDPVLRGMAGSRINILLDGEQILGGCGARMDPPTAYVFPEAYDRVTVLKGPQSVSHGPGASAGTVRFDRSPEQFAETRLRGSVTAGSYRRLDQVLDGQLAGRLGYVRLFGNASESGDYSDGHGRPVHSAYSRWNAGMALGWTPDADTRVELQTQRSDGEASYADRSLDGARFARENVGLSVERRHVSALVDKVEARIYENTIDHVMDNYSLRAPAGMRSAMNPDRLTRGARVAASLMPAQSWQVTVGADTQYNDHSSRMAMSMSGTPAFASLPRTPDASFRQLGAFAEARRDLMQDARLLAGIRQDLWQARDLRPAMLMVMGGGMTSNPSSGQSRNERLTSGFLRHEQDHENGLTSYVGVGHSERFPDYWELIGNNRRGETLAESAFNTRPERNTQLDAGLLRQHGAWRWSASTFVSQVKDYILIQNASASPMAVSQARNVDARTWGGEVTVGHALTPALSADVSLAYVRGVNLTDHRPLAQLPPLETRLGLQWQQERWRAGALWRLVATQNRFDVDRGSIAGQDLGRTGGFGVFSLNGGYQLSPSVQLSVGVDNLFDKAYAEHLSRSGMMGATGYAQTQRVYEPGRLLWSRLQFRF